MSCNEKLKCLYAKSVNVLKIVKCISLTFPLLFNIAFDRDGTPKRMSLIFCEKSSKQAIVQPLANKR